MSKRLVLILIGLTLLTSCGFKLRGNFELPASLDRVEIQGGERELVEQLTELLVKSGSTVVEPGTADAASINITRSEFERQVLTSESSGIASSFNFTYFLDFNVTDAQGKALMEPAALTQIRNLNYEVGNELEVEDEEEFLKATMEQELILQMMRRMARI